MASSLLARAGDLSSQAYYLRASPVEGTQQKLLPVKLMGIGGLLIGGVLLWLLKRKRDTLYDS